MGEYDNDILKTLIAVVTSQENQQEQLKDMSETLKSNTEKTIENNIHLKNQVKEIGEIKVEQDMLDQRIRPLEARQGEYKRVMGLIGLTVSVIIGIFTLIRFL